MIPSVFARFMRPMMMLALTAALLVLENQPVAAQTDQSETLPGQKVAIVIGNQDYESVTDLGNARKDAQDIAALFKEFGFQVFAGYDLNKLEFEELLRTAVLNIPDGADVVFYYAGHGIQLGRRNYLLPVDAKFESVYDLPLETMTLDRVIDTLAARGSAHLAILDSCRDNPFADIRLAADLDADLFETRAGFEVTRTPLNSLVAYSTSPGALAMDGEPGGNSPYTSAILQITRDDRKADVSRLFPIIRERVNEKTGGMQVPWESSTLVRPFYLASVSSSPEVIPVAGEATETISIAKQFDRQVLLNASIEADAGSGLQSVTVVKQPEKGSLSFSNTGGRGALVYSPVIPDVRALDLLKPEIEDNFEVDVLTGSGDTRKYRIELELTFDPCDLQAGDALDVKGVGVFRLPNELDLDAGLKACQAAVANDPGNARFQYQLGRLQQGAAMLDAAFESFSRAVDAGHPRAYYAKAVMLGSERLNRDITNVPYDPDQARELLEAGVADKDPYAMHKLGKKLLREGKTDAERKRGFELLESAVELGHTFSMNELGIYFLRRDTPQYLPERGLKYLKASRLREDIYGYNNLGTVALNGMDGRPPDYDRALSMFKVASAGGHPTAPSNIGRMIVRGQLAGHDENEALDWYDIALKRGDAWGGANGSAIIMNGKVRKKGPADAAVRAAKAALLPQKKPAAQARDRLNKIEKGDLDRALQMLLAELGENISVDGAVGPSTLRALDRVSQSQGFGTGSNLAPEDRLLLAAKVYWAKNPIRYDLF